METRADFMSAKSHPEAPRGRGRGPAMGAFPAREHRARGQAWGGARVTHGKPEGQEIKIKGTEEA